MKIPAYALHGLSAAARRPKTIAILWLANVLCALPLYVLTSAMFAAALGSSLLGARPDMNAIVEVLTSSSAGLRDLMLAGAVLFAAAQLVAIFLAGGVLGTIRAAAEPRPLASSFFEDGGRYYGRFLRLTLLSVLFLIPAAAVYVIIDGILSAVASDPAREQLGFVLTLVRIGAALVLFNLVRMVLDYARIRTVERDARSMALELLAALRFVMGRLGRTLGLYYLFGAAGLALLGLYVAGDGALAKTSGLAAAAGVLLPYQFFIFVRGGLRIAALSAERRLLLDAPAAGPAPAASRRPAQDTGREIEQRPDKLEPGADRDPDQTERQEKQPDQGVEEKDQKGQGPADDQQDQP
jgi:hypothetical protein